jgi:hypothetical protein
MLTGSPQIDADLAFGRAARRRRSAAMLRRLRRGQRGQGALRVYGDCEIMRRRAALGRSIREVSLRSIGGTLEPSRAPLFDASFRPAGAARERWRRLWLAEHRGDVLPPVVLVEVGDGYAVRDGHHRVSVAAARGALTIDAIVE